MESSYQAALAAATDSSINTQWQDERPDVPTIAPQHVSVCQDWLASIDFPALHQQSSTMWHAISSNWISFLSATSKNPSPILAPNRKKIQWGPGRESNADSKRRFRTDTRVRISVQNALWRLFDSKEALVERWPAHARLTISRAVNENSTIPFASLFEDFAKQRRFNSVWSSLICFLLYCSEEDGSIEEMGLVLSEDLEDDLLDIQNALIFDKFPMAEENIEQGQTEEEIYSLILKLLTDTNATPTTNPLLWWIAILVRSSIEQGSDDYISRGHFGRNILPMDLDIQGRLEGVLHFAKVFLLDLAFTTWKPVPNTQLLEVQEELNAVDNQWISKFDSTKPTSYSDKRKCNSPAWNGILDHISITMLKYIKVEGTVMYSIMSLVGD